MSRDIFVHDAGKGSNQRKVDKEKYDKNYDVIFRKTKKDKEIEEMSQEACSKTEKRDRYINDSID